MLSLLTSTEPATVVVAVDVVETAAPCVAGETGAAARRLCENGLALTLMWGDYSCPYCPCLTKLHHLNEMSYIVRKPEFVVLTQTSPCSFIN